MNNKVFLFLMLILMALGCKKDDDDGDNGLPVGSEIQMSANSFLPQTLTVTAGTAVRWVNSSQVNHTVTSSGGFFDDFLAPGESFVYTFSTAGTYNYICTIHAGMAGIVIVE